MTASTSNHASTPATSAPAFASRRFFRRLIAILVAINLFVIGLSVFWVNHAREQNLTEARISAANLSLALDRYLTGLVRNIDLTLSTAADEYQRQTAHRQPDPAALEALLERQLARLPELDSLRIASADGRVRHGRGVAAAAAISIADRDYFVRARDEANAALIISKPLFARISKKWVIAFARRLNHPDGSFAGVVYINLALDHFNQTFAALDIGKQGAVALRDGALGVIARYPEPEGVASTIGNANVSQEFRGMVGAGLTSGTYRVASRLDGIERTFAFRKISSHPLYISVGFATADVLEAWRRELFLAGAVAGLFLLMTAGMFRLVLAAWRRQLAVTTALAEQEAKFRTVADFTYDWEYWQSEDRKHILHMSPSCERISGYTAAEFSAAPELLTQIVHPDDSAAMEAHLKDYAQQAEGAIDFRIVDRKGEVRWIAHVCRPVFAPDGGFLGRRVSNREITDRKNAEVQIQQLAYYDTLTGLPNRRMLLDRLGRALSLVKRHQRSLAVMFLDLDHFKTINDTLGHDAGDALLREVATRLNTCVRVGDTVCRQGGDEFIVVLTEIAHADDAAVVAEKIVARIAEPFEVDGNTLRISTSVGIAVYPVNGGDDIQDLLKKADQAMYAAKAGGRNAYRFFADD